MEPLNIVLLTGISGSGKSVAMHALEDAGFYCIDNLPPELLRALLDAERQRGDRRVAIAVDVRSAGSLPVLMNLIGQLQAEDVAIRTLFLDASTETLVRRFSETRRPHPLSWGRGGAGPAVEAGAAVPERGDRRALVEAIELERELLAELRETATVLDTSQLRPAQLRQWVRDLVSVPHRRLTLVFESFAFKQGVPLDADLVFDVRVLPNPYYERELRSRTGRDGSVADYMASQPEAREMIEDIRRFLERWLPGFEEDQRSYLTVAIGCTGGQHRSVYLAETLGSMFRGMRPTLVRHRELDAR